MVSFKGKCSWFGGPDDKGVGPHEGLALVPDNAVTHPFFKGLFLPSQPEGTTGTARRLDPTAYYIAMRWDYDRVPKEFLRGIVALVRANGVEVFVRLVDWGPDAETGRIVDMSKGLQNKLGVKTDDVVEVILPWD